MGSRRYQEPPGSLPKMDKFHRRIREIMDMLPLPLNDQGQLEPPTLYFTSEAKKEWIEKFNSVEATLKPNGIFYDIPDFASKFGEQAARIAGVLHIFENGPTGMIELGTMQRAIRIAIWHIWEANLIFSKRAVSPGIKDATLLLDWIRIRCQESQKLMLKQVAILHEGPNKLREQKRRDTALHVLQSNDWIHLETINRIKMISVNPAILD